MDPKKLSPDARDAITNAGSEAVEELVSDGLSREEAQSIIVRLLDGVLVWHLFLSADIADVLEKNDGPALQKALDAITPHLVELLTPDPTRIEARADRAARNGHPRIAARRRERARRVRARQARRAEEQAK